MVSAQQPTGSSPRPAGQGRAGGGRALRRHAGQRPFAVTCARGIESVPAVGGSLRGPFGAGSPQRRPWTSPTGPCSGPGSWGHFLAKNPQPPGRLSFWPGPGGRGFGDGGCCAEEAGAARHPPAPATGRSLEGGGGPGALKPCPKASRPLPSVAGTKPPPGFPVGGNAHSPAFLPSPKFSRAGGRYQARASAAGVGKAKRRRVNTDDLLLLGN